MAGALAHRHGAALRAGSPAQPVLEQRPVVGARVAHHQLVHVHVLVLAGVGHGRLEDLEVEDRGAPRRELQQLQGLVDVPPADQVRGQARLARGDAREAVLGDEGAHVAAGSSPLRSASFLLVWPRKTRVCANSPSLWPTMSSVTNTLMCVRPLWTRNDRPLNSGVMVERRDQVLIGFDLPSPRATRLASFASTNGPFLTLRPMVRSQVRAHDDW